MSGDGTGDQPIGAATDGYSDIAYAPNGQLVAFVRTAKYDKNGTSVTAPELFRRSDQQSGSCPSNYPNGRHSSGVTRVGSGQYPDLLSAIRMATMKSGISPKTATTCVR